MELLAIVGIGLIILFIVLASKSSGDKGNYSDGGYCYSDSSNNSHTANSYHGHSHGGDDGGDDGGSDGGGSDGGSSCGSSCGSGCGSGCS